ncbi:transposase [Shimazuella alba]|uniref:Transposase n=1 Tax=Shimazuella alba TaxID=2690964 RepID=A0A6I4W5Q0_9BACL|nr:transposase [Shimazuella alba]MXQ55642.1 transposase [Shimazuella alba]
MNGSAQRAFHEFLFLGDQLRFQRIELLFAIRHRKYFVSVLYERNYCPYIPVEKYKVVRIDLGLKHSSILSDGEKVNAPTYFRKYEQQLAKAHRTVCRRTKGGSNWQKARIQVTKIHGKITNQCHDFLQSSLRS